MVEYIERASAIDSAKLTCFGRTDQQGLVLEILTTVQGKICEIPAADVVPAEELAKRDQEIKRLQAEVDRLHKENFWLTGHHEGKQDGTTQV